MQQDVTTIDVGVEVVHDVLSVEVRRAWEGLLALQPAQPPFLAPEWFEATCRAEPGRRWGVLLWRDGGRIIGLLPFVRRTYWTASVSSLMAPEHPPVLVDPTARDAFWAGLARWLRRAPVRMLNLGRYTDADLPTQIAGAQSQGLAPLPQPVMSTVWMDLPATWEAYLQGVSRPSRYKARHAEGAIREEIADATFITTTDPTESAALVEELIRLSCLRFSAAGKQSMLAQPTRAAFYRQVIAWLVREGSSVVFALRVGTRTVAVATAIHQHGQEAAYYHMVGRDPAGLPSRFSPGIALACQVVRWSIARGARRLNLGQGVMPYKGMLGGVEIPQYELQIARGSLEGRLLCKVDAAISLAGDALRARRTHPYPPVTGNSGVPSWRAGESG